MAPSVRASLTRTRSEERVPPIRWADIKHADPKLAARLYEKAREYGYPS
jgi:hypothetical protein